MGLTLRNIYTFLFLLGVFFIPFNSWEGIKALGEFKKESSAFFFLVGFFVLILEIIISKRLLIPLDNILVKLLLIFLLWVVATIFLNFPVVYESYYKRTTGVMRFIRQFFALFLSCGIFFLFYYNVLRNLPSEEILFKIRKVFLYSFLFVCIYGFLEIGYSIFGSGIAYETLMILDYFPFIEYYTHNAGRISSVTFEPPALATFLITVSGWMFSYIITHNGLKKYLPTIFILILTYYSGSRTALIVILVQLAVFFTIFLTKEEFLKVLKMGFIVIVFFSGMFFLLNPRKIVADVENKMESLDFKGNLKTNISNQSRFGIQYANLKVFSEHPFIGVGYGQQGFHAVNYYPIWAKKDNYEFEQMYLNKKNPMFPPGYNLYVRLLAETGIIGLSIFLYFFYVIYRKCKILVKNKIKEISVIGVVLYISFIGFALNFLQLDTFRNYGLWISFAILVKITSDLTKKQTI